MSLDPDFVVVPVTVASSAAQLEWAIRASELDAAITLLGSVIID